MIKHIFNNKNFSDLICILPNSHYTDNIDFLFRCYGADTDFCEFYSADSALICIFEKTSAIIAGELKDFEETALFLSGCNLINSDYSVCKELHKHLDAFENVPVDFQLAKISDKKSQDLNENPNLKDVYTIISSGFSDIDFNLWYTDTSHKIRHNLGKCYTYKNSASVTASYYNNGIFLSQVSTLTTERHKGYASQMLHEVTGLYKDKKVYLIAEHSKRPFYKSAGFEIVGTAGRLRKTHI